MYLHYTINYQFYSNINENYGDENDGYIWCNNCGQELNLAEYETIEGITGTGARLVTHEEIEYEVEDINKYVREFDYKNN